MSPQRAPDSAMPAASDAAADAGIDMVAAPADIDRRIITPSEFDADTGAFVDVRIPGSAGKASYSFIGPGVSQNASQKVNLTEPHGFCVGAAGMPHGVVNNQHMHYTAEVFICTRGKWQMRLGQHGEQTLEIGADTVFSPPTWVFRGFKNIGDDDGWLFTVLGGDDSGGILWAPQVLDAAAETGLHLSSDYEVLDARNGDSIADAIAPLSVERLEELDNYSDAEIEQRVVGPDRLEWSTTALLSDVLAGHGGAIAPVIGFGLTEDRRQRPPIWTPHGFSVEWLRLEEATTTGAHRIAQPQALFAVDGDWRITYNLGQQQVQRDIPQGSVVSIPPGCWREFTNIGTDSVRCVVVCGGDERNTIDWDPAIVAEACGAGWGRDASGYLAPLDLLARWQR